MGEPSFSLGIDENGLGPRLGPLIVTGVLARTTAGGTAIANAKPRGRLSKRLGDSKKLVAFGNAALGEAWAREVSRRTRVGAGAGAPDALIHALAIEERESLRALCPTHHVAQCWSDAGEAFEADHALCKLVSSDLDRLFEAGVEILGVHVAIVCTKRLNLEVERGRSRFDVDLHTMERIALAARARAGSEIYATCGKVGGFDRYGERFGPLAGQLHATVCEGRARSEYTFPGTGTLAFVRDAEDENLLVCMASLIGKWVRDRLMSRIVRFYREPDPDLPDASGYHDPVTTRFIAASALARRSRGVDDGCFQRNRLEIAAVSRPEASTSAPRRGSASRRRPRGTPATR